MKNILFSATLMLFMWTSIRAQQEIVQGTIVKTGSNNVTIYGKPNVDLYNTLFENINICISIPLVSPIPDLEIINNYMPSIQWETVLAGYKEVIGARIYYTFIGNDVNSSTIDWLADQASPIAEFRFYNGPNMTEVLVNLEDLTSWSGGGTGQSYWYVQANVLGDITNNTAMFYGGSVFENNHVTGGNSFVTTANTVALPVELLTFNAEKVDACTGRLIWKTGVESNCRGFELERCLTEGAWAPIAFVPAKGSNCSYEWLDDKPFAGKNFYRLKMVDNDGSFQYSTIRMLDFTDAYTIGAYPNPTSNTLFVQFGPDVAHGEAVMLEMVDASGKRVLEQNLEAVENILLELQLLEHGLVPGAYMLSIRTERELLHSEPIIVQ